MGLDSEHRETIIEILVEHRVDLNCTGTSDNIRDVRPLHLAAMWGYDLAVKLLLYHGADASLRDSNGLSAIDYASIFDNYLCISLLLRYGSLNSTSSAWSAIMDSSLGESNADSSFDNCLYLTALDLGGDETRTLDRESHFSSILDGIDEAEEEDYDPLDHVRDEELEHEISDRRIRMELILLGKNPGPIVASNRRIYLKWLAHLRKQDKELVYSPRTKTKTKQNGYSIELNIILTGKFPLKQALELERSLIDISARQINHGHKNFFNYILIDPRISQNLPDQAMEASDSDTSHFSPTGGERKTKHVMEKINRKIRPELFAKFLESIFYIGKGQEKRDLMHLYDALADRGSITHAKIDRIRSIWQEGHGVVSLHLSHNLTSKEALTREALMIETIGLDNLTNVIRGSFQLKLGWNEHKRKLLGGLFLFRAYMQLINEGERQIKRDDLKVIKNNN